MKQRSLTGILFGVMGWAIAACAGGNGPGAIAPNAPADSAIENSAQGVESAESADRIVALTSLTADIIHTLDDDRLVGIPGSPLLRQDPRFSALDIVSEGQVEPDLEKIVALEPNLVIGAQGFHDKTLARLSDLGIQTLPVDVASWENLKQLTQDLAQRIDADPQPLLARYEACLAQASETTLSVLVLVSRQPLLSPNKESWAGDFLTQFNVKNLTAELQGQSPFSGYITLSEEKVLDADPDLLLIVETDNTLLSQLQQDAFWGQLKATQSNQIHTFEYFGLVNPGSLASIEATCQKLATLGRVIN
jgi:iron complex transport system substrate-binding protein